MQGKLFESEMKVMEVIWEKGDVTAKEIAAQLNEQIGWSKTTTYTVIKKCVAKGAIERIDPNFVCHALLTKEEVQEAETTEFINRWYHGAADQLVASILERKQLSPQEIERLKQRIEALK